MKERARVAWAAISRHCCYNLFSTYLRVSDGGGARGCDDAGLSAHVC